MNYLDFTGKQNEYLGLVFKIQDGGSGYVVSFYIQELKKRGIPPLTITMYPEHNHGRPHIHVDKGRHSHIASIAIDGEIMEGATSLSRKERNIILDWISQHENALNALWDHVNRGKTYESELQVVQDTWEYNGYCYKGKKPDKELTIGNVKIWYNGSIQEYDSGDGRKRIACTKDVCVYYHIGYDDRHLLLEIEGQNIQSNLNM